MTGAPQTQPVPRVPPLGAVVAALVLGLVAVVLLGNPAYAVPAVLVAGGLALWRAAVLRRTPRG